MNTNIYAHELRSRLKSIIIWSASLAIMIFFFESLYPVFADQAAIMNEFLAKYPPEVLAAFGMNNMDLAAVLGFFSLIYLFVQLCLAIQAGNYGVGLVSVEEAELTADFLLTRPVSRAHVLTSKLLAALTALLITDVVVWVTSLVAIPLFKGERDYDFNTLLLLFAGMVIFQLFFLCVGLIISLLVKRVRSVTPYALGLGFGAYVLNAFSGIFGDIALENITPFKHLDANYIVANGSFNLPLVLLNVAISVIALALSYWLYIRRDIHAVS